MASTAVARVVFLGIGVKKTLMIAPPSGCGNGTCIDLVDNYTCQCNVGFAGQHCEVIVRNCSNDSCFQGVLCIQKTYTISCGPCPNGFTGDGKTCIDIDDCMNHRCSNSGSCVDGLNNYTCNCLEGYTGNHCEIDIDRCVNHTCLNGASCIDGINNYTCNCAPGFTGDLCGTNIDDCVNHTCNVISGSCKDGQNSYSCICLVGFTGDHCETDIDDCVNHTCANGATCVDGTNNFSCNCLPGYSGERCETAITMHSTHVSTLNPYVTTMGLSSTSAKSGLYSTHVVIDTITESSKLNPIRTTSAIKESIVSSLVVRDMPTTETSPTTVTPSQPKKSENQETVFVVEIRIEKIWNEDLKDTTSSAFNELASVIETEVKKQYSRVKNFIGVKIIAFRPGSIVAEFKLLFNQKVSDDTAVAPLKTAVKEGSLGPLIVIPDSVKIKMEHEDPTNDAKEKLHYPIIIGASCGGIFVIALVSICLVRHCQRQKRLQRRRVSSGMPSEVPFPNQEKYELKETRSKEDIVSFEELGLWKATGNNEKSKGGARYQEVGIANMASDNYDQEIGTTSDPERYQEIGIVKKAGKY
ncbi:protein eyes shut-like [Stylophora pistillata]|uniref:protein eyes shut-like n=1 Tax=Stylophora pistillata TaxID=50429 RepID=UPI000C045B31|nr:protein eyes shut-like [Stylophora pistillata]